MLQQAREAADNRVNESEGSSDNLTEEDKLIISWAGFLAGTVAGSVFDSWPARLAAGFVLWMLSAFVAGSLNDHVTRTE
ncbi:hypothetical protein C478_07387 [Natrinema thermotolerans DSM 11552]|nr:hypothetical protein C478_07387 [Natrinema thermotolerans DSM 11552]